MNDLAAYYKRHGLKVEGPRGENQIVNKLVEVLGTSQYTVGMYLSSEFKRSQRGMKGREPVPASLRVEKVLGKSVVERHRVEVLEEAKPKYWI